MKRIFKFLKDDEHIALLQRAERKKYQEGDALIVAGQEQTAIYVVVNGEVKVITEPAGFAIEITRHGPGEIVGEMSFIEGQPASAGVVAAEESSALIITHEQIEQMTKENPGFGGRFYHSLAEILSRRLRETSGMVAQSDSPWGDS